MRKMLLTSAGFTTPHITEAFLRLLDQSPLKSTAVIITTAAVQLRSQARPNVKAKQALENMGFQRVDFLDIEFEDAERLREYDVICLGGGNPFYLLHHLRVSGSDRIIEELGSQGKVLMGISAGTLALGPDIHIVDHFTPYMNQVGLTDLTALHLNNEIVFPHYGREDKFPHEKNIEERIQDFEAKQQCEVQRITDVEAICIHGGVTCFIPKN
ncbi:Type 1 glutamine amidotransferase-like domain-containing protein [Paenibacillus sp. H1-7]|uniref:Type 1 glutamine amidotransferase-like domain-containing protein n=1 Tax=Paenibacillus sp. H1-7 TaxID=2282849 RepID=UPI001EF7B2EC|nr:Type 1 glutamine amidotransferase-like domain-containing protein [Paenibacillus sp. H1-7]